MTDKNLQQHVADELYWEPKVDSSEIAVGADGGRITLRGTVGSVRAKLEARKAAERVYGVTAVDNQLEVRLMNDQRRSDAELRADVLQALILDSLVPSTVDAKVDNGFVTLTGTADWQYQRDEAEYVASNIVGAYGVLDAIELREPAASAHDVRERIRSAFERNAKLDANYLDVTTSSGTVTVEGTVTSWAEHDEAIDAAWAAPGVTSVKDKITVAY